MNCKFFSVIAYLANVCVLSACSFASQQLLDKRMEEQLLSPGALDSPVANNFDEYHFKFLDKYRIVHAWPVTSACKYAGSGTMYKMGETSYGEVQWVLDIIEEGGNTKQRNSDPGWNFNRFVRSVKVQRPVYDTVNGVRGIVRYEENEEGLQPICFEAWVGSSHSLVMRLHKRDIATWKSLWSSYNPSGVWTEKFIGVNHWQVLENSEANLASSGTGGWFRSYLTPVGDTGYTLALQLGATQQSLKSPQEHAAFQAMFKHLIESVKIEPLTPAIEADMAQLKAKAFEITRQNCLRMKNPPAYCKKYLEPQ
jgi:hypothetical protein